MDRRVGVFFAIVFFCGVLSSNGQVITGTISGTVKDSTGAVMPGVTMQLQNTDTGIARTVTTDNRGYYSAPNLALGKYEVTASLSGFQTEVRTGITLNLGQNAIIDLTLTVGAITERVEVTAEAPLIETTSANVSGLVNERQVQDLPLNARDLVGLAPLYAGVSFAPTGGQSASKGFATKLTIAGTRYNSSLFQVDGLDINDATGSAGGAAGILMGAETVREFNVITNGYSAEYGKHSGGVFNAVTKSGTNTLHGSLFDFLRNDALDARNFFDDEIPAYRRNQFGGSVGGPIVKDRSFFFFSYEGLRERLGLTNTFNVPSLDVRQGNLPNPTTGELTAVPIAPAVKPFLESYPVPNGRDLGDGTAEWILPQSFPTNQDFYTVRADHKFSEKDSLFGRYTSDDALRTQGNTMNTNTLFESRAHYVALGETRIFSPRVINQLLLGYNRSLVGEINEVLPGAIFPLKNFTDRKENTFGSISVPGFSGWGGDTTVPSIYLLNMFQYKDDAFYNVGSHSFKFGFNAQRLNFKATSLFNGPGAFSFNSISDFLIGRVNSFTALTATSQSQAYVRQTIYGMYAQDDYRVSPRLTVNLGLRYEFTTTPNEKYGRVSNFRDYHAFNQTQDDLILGNPTFLNPSLTNFAPRIGLAWDPTGSGKTSIRAGAGIFHDQINAGGVAFSFFASVPFVVVGNIPTRGLAKFPNAFFEQQELLNAAVNNEGFHYFMEQPTAYKYSVDIQREVFSNTSVNLGFSGTRGVHLMRVLSMNARVAEIRDGRLFVPSNAPFRSPGFGRIRPRYTDVSSNYYGLRLTVTRRFSKGLQFQTAYTFSKATDDGSNWTGSSDWANSPGQARYMDVKDKSLASFDIRHNFVTNFTYDLPGGNLQGAGGKVLGGWQISGILSLQGGNPFTVSTGVNPSYMRSGYIGDYPDVAPGVEGFQYDTRNPDRYFDPSAFLVPQTGFIGNAARNILTGPGKANFDLVLVKSTALTERVALQFRSEFYNLFNRANFGLPAGRIFANASGAISGSVGRITNTATISRQVQFGMRLVF